MGQKSALHETRKFHILNFHKELKTKIVIEKEVMNSQANVGKISRECFNNKCF